MTPESHASPPPISSTPSTGHADAHGRRRLLELTVAALGVVYGDIGTSPLYALRECFAAEHGLAIDAINVLGVLSLVFWSLVLVISVKYLVFVLRADNHGEGGILALLALVLPTARAGSRRAIVLVGLALFGAALLYGDGMLTPAISVLSAIEGLEVVTPVFTPWVVPITVVILIGLFVVQPFGTARVGAVFGPVTMLWFLVLGGLGIAGIVEYPEVWQALDPRAALAMFEHHGWKAFVILGVVFLVVTGGEALYADMGHFGATPIRLAWFVLALPCLLLNYFGQGALLLRHPDAIDNPFFRMAPQWALVPLVILATAATIIASQAIISGAFSLSRQAVQLGYCPRLEIRHTSALTSGQVYVPLVNWVLMLGTLAIVIGFGTSTALAGAYGVAVTTTMVITTLLLYLVARDRWHWPAAWAVGLVCLFLVFDLAYFLANIVKIAAGGWLPMSIALAITALMTTWNRGRALLHRRMSHGSVPLDEFVELLPHSEPVRVEGTAVFLTADPHGTPAPLLHNLKHNRVLHEHVLVVNIVTLEVPRVADRDRVVETRLAHGFVRASIHYGFMESPDVPAALAPIYESIGASTMSTTYFLGRERIVAARHALWTAWRRALFDIMSRNARDASLFFGLPPNRVVELGALVDL